MKQLGYGRDYKYAHDYDGAYVAQHHLPEQLQGQKYYIPTELGYEKNIKQRLDHWRRQITKK
jgi:putative ATPase